MSNFERVKMDFIFVFVLSTIKAKWWLIFCTRKSKYMKCFVSGYLKADKLIWAYFSFEYGLWWIFLMNKEYEGNKDDLNALTVKLNFLVILVMMFEKKNWFITSINLTCYHRHLSKSIFHDGLSRTFNRN